MLNRREIRRLAMLILYQIDLRGEKDAPLVRESLGDYLTWQDQDDLVQQTPRFIAPTAAELAAGREKPVPHAITDEAYDLAWGAWKAHARIDEILCEMAPDWPTYRQPPVDRAILRLAAYEIMTERAPVAVAITEAVQIAKDFCAVQSPSFINAVLDRAAPRFKALSSATTANAADTPSSAADSEADEASSDPWLNDAIATPNDRPEPPVS